MTRTGILSVHPRPGMFPEWPEHAGIFERLYIRRGRMGDVATVKMRCDGKRHIAFTFNPRLVEELKLSAQRSRFLKIRPTIWLKGPIEEIDDQGTRDARMRIIYFRDDTPLPRGVPLPAHLC